jgi:hypothetical protein
MAYKLVDFDAGKSKLEDEKEKQEATRSFDAVGFDPAVLRDLKALVTAAIKIEEELHTKITESHGTAKRLMGQMETLVKKGKKLTNADVQVINGMVDTIKECSEEADEASTDAKPALLQWRGDWRGSWIPLLSDAKKADALASQRKRVLDWAPADLAMRKRMNEYATRAKDVQKAANQFVSKGLSLAGNEQDEVRQFTADVKKYADECAKAAKSGAVAQIELWIKNTSVKKKPDPAMLKTYDQMFATCEQLAKPTRGALKTLEIKLATFKKTAGQFDSANRKLAEKAYAVAAKQVKTAQADVKKISNAQSKGAKVLAGLKKLKK